MRLPASKSGQVNSRALRFAPAGLALFFCVVWPSPPAFSSEPPFPPPVAKYASILAEGPQRPWNPPRTVTPVLWYAAYPDPVPMPGSFPVPAEVEKGEGEDEAFRSLRRGLDALREEKLDDALFEFQEGARKGAPSSDECWFWLGETRVRKGKTAEAVVAYSRVSGAKKAEALYRMARLAQKEDRAQTAIGAWKAIAADESNPHRGEALYRLGVAGVLEGEEGDAQLDFAAALEVLPPGSGAATGAAFEAARINRDGANTAEAERLLTSLLVAGPDHPLSEGARVLLSWVEGDSGRFDAAWGRAEKALSNSALPEGFAVRARYQLARSAAAAGDMDRASRTSSELLLTQEGPWAGWSSADRAWALYDSGRFEAALGAYSEAARLWKGEGAEEIAFAAGECLFRLGRYPEAAAQFARVDESSEALPWARHRGAEALARVGDRKGALVLLGKLLADRSGYPELKEARTLAGRLNFEEGNYREALALLKDSAESSSDGEILNYLRGWEAFSAERYGTAAELFEKHLAVGAYARKRVEAANYLAKAEHENGRTDSAVAALRIVAAEAESPEEAEKARYEIGWILVTAGRDEEGVAELVKLVADYPKGSMSARARYAIAQSRMEAGRFEEADAGFKDIDPALASPELSRLAAKGRIEALFALGKDEEALSLSRSLGEDQDAMSSVVMALLRLGRIDQALAETDRYAAKFPVDSGLADLDMATVEVLVTTGRKAEAIDRLEKVAKRLAGSGRDAALMQRGHLLEEAGRREEALSVFASLSATAADVPIKVAAARRAAALEVALDRRREAVGRLETALREPGLTDDHAHRLLNDLAVNLTALGEATAALEKARRASTMGDGEGAESLKTDVIIADALEKSGNPNAALETLLRIGYHYDLRRPAASAAARRAAYMLEKAGRVEEAGELRARLAAVQAEGSPSPEGNKAK